jgi:hypothetical protein
MTEKFEQWAILEIMGHQTYAGRVSNQELGGASFVRIDVPEVDGCPAFTKLFGAGSIYCITMVSEEVARMRVASLRKQPMDVWDLPEEVRDAVRAAKRAALPAPSDGEADVPW